MVISGDLDVTSVTPGCRPGVFDKNISFVVSNSRQSVVRETAGDEESLAPYLGFYRCNLQTTFITFIVKGISLNWSRNDIPFTFMSGKGRP